jgi:hypothetical protein
MARGTGNCSTAPSSVRARGAQAPRRLYHGTSAAAIQAEGFRLDYPEGSDHVIWLTDTPDLAARYGEVVLEVEAAITNPVKLIFGERLPSGKSRAELLADDHDAVQVSYREGSRAYTFGACEVFTVSDLSLLRATDRLLISHYDCDVDRWHAEEPAASVPA